MTEFALIVPVFMLIVVGMLAFGRVFFYWIGANHLANETARWAVVDRNPDPVEYTVPAEALQQYAADSGGTLEFSDAKVCIDFPAPAGRRRSASPAGEDPEAVQLPADPRHRDDHDPRHVDDADRALREQHRADAQYGFALGAYREPAHEPAARRARHHPRARRA